jgi:hypothetical protein
MENLAKFTTGQKLQARFISDSDCILNGTVIKRTAKMATIKVDGYSDPKRVKIHIRDGQEFCYPLGQYSMALTFRA